MIQHKNITEWLCISLIIIVCMPFIFFTETKQIPEEKQELNPQITSTVAEKENTEYTDTNPTSNEESYPLDITDLFPQYAFYGERYAFHDILTENSIAYDESASASLHDKIKQVDSAIMQTILRFDIPLDRFHVEDSYIQIRGNTVFTFQKIRIDLPVYVTTDEWKSALAEQLDLWAHDAYLDNAPNQNHTDIIIGSEISHEIYYTPLAQSAKMSIVIDDLGTNTEHALSLLKLHFPVTFSILPRTKHAHLIAHLAHHSGREVFLHQPMQALDSQFSVSYGLNVDDIPNTIKKKLEENLADVPFATGINNHTGSKFTADYQAVVNFLIALREIDHNINILDSLTIGSSKLKKLSEKFLFNTAQRKVFIDNIRKQEEIEKQLNYALQLALEDRTKHIVVIGHPYKETLATLSNWKAYKEKNVEILHVFPYQEQKTQDISSN